MLALNGLVAIVGTRQHRLLRLFVAVFVHVVLVRHLEQMSRESWARTPFKRLDVISCSD